MKDIEIVLENLASQEIKPDQAQKLFLEKFIDCDSSFRPSTIFRKQTGFSSIYLWGPVGRGKTLLLQSIASSYFSNVGTYHFLEFMQLMHSNLSELNSVKNPLSTVAKNLSKKYKVIFIDEFQVEDIADAMIIGLIIESLSQCGVRIMISSNASPDLLYKDGLQRDKFLNTINFIQSEFLVFSLQGEQDYRLKEIAKFDTVISHNVAEFLHHTFEGPWSEANTFSINDREFSCKGQSSKFLWLSFKEFFSEPCGSLDFIEMCKSYEWVFITDFHKCDDENLDKVRRFISFIDITYQERQKMKLFSDDSLLKDLYQGSQLKFLWERSESRLHEITSSSYLKNLEKN
jgi:cell division protein ZapE